MWGEKLFDPLRFPDPAALVEKLHAMNVRLMVSIWPTMRGGENAEEMRSRDLFLSTAGPQPRMCSTYDAFNPEARALYWRQVNEGYFRFGVDAWWCDCTEPFEADWNGEFKPEPWLQMQVNLNEFKKYIDPEYVNAYSLLHSQGLYEHQMQEAPERRMLNLTRSAYPGQQRYGTVTWSGDTAARWDVLAAQIPAGLNFCMTGCPWWTTDIGAFFVRNDPEKWFWSGDYDRGVADLGYRELYLRWFQYGTFLPLFRSHGTDTPREIWRFGEADELFYDTLVRFLHLRYRLLPYLYSLAGWTWHRDYTPMRALVFDFPTQNALLDVRDQFMLGPALMVCPVVTPMYYEAETGPISDAARTRRVLLPGGCRWYDFWTGERHEGGQEITVGCPLETMPVFVRAGSILPLGPVMQHTGESPDAPWEIRVYPGADGEFDLYEDAGEGMEYQQGECAWTPLRWVDATGTLVFGERQGTYASQVGERMFRVVKGAFGVEESTEPMGSYSGFAVSVPAV